jgi:cellulose synthase/poly-beta-1,6-N-acetylglucosamine synthase-like glycosyltransferase
MDYNVKISLIISVYKSINFLDLVLQSVGLQSYNNFEVIIAEDNDSDKMKEFINEQRKKYSFSIQHVSHPDVGVRKCKILNDAIKISQGQFLVFIDGDCILHKNFLREYAKYQKLNYCLYGRRVMLDEDITNILLETKDISQLSLLKLFRTNSSHLEEGIYLPWFRLNLRAKNVAIKGCNFGISKEDMYKINGFDEDYKNLTIGEDDDIKWRLKEAGIKFKSLRNKAVQYHLFHKRKDRSDIYEENFKLYQKKKSKNQYFCDNGLVK